MFCHLVWLHWDILVNFGPAEGASQSHALGILGNPWLASVVWALVSLTTAHQSVPDGQCRLSSANPSD